MEKAALARYLKRTPSHSLREWIRILMLGTSLLPGQASRGGAIGISDAMSHRRGARELVTLRNFLGNGGRCESVAATVVIPAVRSIEHPKWRDGQFSIPERQKGPGSHQLGQVVMTGTQPGDSPPTKP